MGKFEEVYSINVNDKTEKKGNLTYLSWTYAWAEFKKVYPLAEYEVVKFNGLPYVKEDGVGVMVYTRVTAEDLTYEMWLPVMNNANKAILQPTMTEINKTIMRCLTKNLAMFGLGLYVYAGEDLPESADGEDNKQPQSDENIKPIAKPQQSPKKAQKTDENKTGRETAEKKAFCAKFGIPDYEKTISIYEKRLGNRPFNDWTEEEFLAVEEDIKAIQKRREQQKKRTVQLSRIEDDDLPFPMED